MGSAISFDLVGNQLPFTAFDPRNLVIHDGFTVLQAHLNAGFRSMARYRA